MMTYSERIKSISDKHLRETKEKQEFYQKNVIDNGDGPLGSISRMDTDDHSWILPPPGFKFTPIPNHPNGGIYGNHGCGMNFRALLECHPVHIDPVNSLAGGWMLWFVDDYCRPRWSPEYDYSHLKPYQEKYGLIHGIGTGQHFTPDFRIGLELGWGGLLEKIRKYREINPDKKDFYDALEDVTLGTQDWIRRHAKEARLIAEKEKDPQIQKNLVEMAEINEKLISSPPDTFREACQWVAWYTMVAEMYNASGAIGSMDDFLKPYYDQDIAKGILTDEEAIFHLACLLSKESKYIEIGGTYPNGKDRTNRLSFLILEAVHRLQLPSELCIRIHDDMNPELLKRGVEVLFEDRGAYPNFIGHKGITEGFIRNGYPVELARQREKSGCNWQAIPGREYTMNDTIKLNFAKVFEVAFREMMADQSINPSIDELWKHFRRHLQCNVEVAAAGIDFNMEHMHKVLPELVLDLLCYGTIEKGLDAAHGGVEFYNIGVDGAGLATVADSFGALEQLVEKEKQFSWDEILHLLDTDFADNEEKRLRLKAVPHYGSGGSLADDYAKKIVSTFASIVKEKPTPDGFNMIPGLFSWVNTRVLGEAVGATPNGRHAKDPISFGANPDPGFVHSEAPTALANALASVQCGYGNSSPLQLDLDPGLGDSDELVEKMIQFLRVYCDMGGTLININVFNKDKILEAHKNPEKYPDLIVRVTGFSAYFCSLTPKYRQLIVDRIIQS